VTIGALLINNEGTEMIESLKGAVANGHQHNAHSQPVRQPVEEKAALRQPELPGEAETLSAAIQRLITERDGHKTRASHQEHELTRLRAVNEELRRQHEQAALIRDHYMRLATEVVATLKHIDCTIHEVVQKTLHTSDKSDRGDAALISLARRFSPQANGARYGETVS
jgi:hypothetical protein